MGWLACQPACVLYICAEATACCAICFWKKTTSAWEGMAHWNWKEHVVRRGGGNGELDVEQKNKKKETISSVRHPHRSGSKQTVSMSVNGTAPPLHHSFFFFLLFPFSCLTVRQKCSEAFRCCYGNRRQPKWGKDELTPHRRTFIF